ncbi:hypothetical protein Pmani_037781 [Petrolisthes manimaculis]|uniref:Mitochondrial ribosomal protein S34 n=1 Tax=Petrolisthes manimaculis TaxID=1843537 RepID=A0AAE1NGK1_9EUCA|nr:hypothetical protein Pmani_037781 [Petrolisthes manimaculis]
MPYVLIGRTHSFYGKRLWELVGHLKEFGAGRLVVRSRFERYPEPCYFRIVSARPNFDNGRPHKDEDNMEGKVLVEKIFRGKNYGVVDISDSAYKTDFRLIHKHEETKYLRALQTCTPRQINILPRTVEMPTLLKMVAEREGHERTVLTMKTSTNPCNARVAEEGEQPNVNISVGLGTPVSPQLYKGVI